MSDKPPATRYSFLASLEEYYGPYPEGSDGLRLALIEYIRDEIDTDMLGELRRYVIRTRPRAWGPPDVAGLEQAVEYAADFRSGRLPVKLRRSNVMRSGGWSSSAVEGDIPTEAERQEVSRLMAEAFGKLGIVADGGDSF